MQGWQRLYMGCIRIPLKPPIFPQFSPTKNNAVITTDRQAIALKLNSFYIGGIMTQLNTIDPKLKIDAVRKTMLGGVDRSTVYRWIKTQGFPKPLKLSPSCSVWSVKQVNEWLESREAFNAVEVA